MSQTQSSALLSVILPAFNEEASIPRAADTITSILAQAGIPCELIFVDDGSRDRSWDAIQRQITHPVFHIILVTPFGDSGRNLHFF